MKLYYLHNEALLAVKSLYERAADTTEKNTQVLIGAGATGLIETFYTDLEEPYTNDTLSNTWVFRINALTLGGAPKLYAKVSKRGPDDSETLLFTSDLSATVTSKKTYSFVGTGAGHLDVHDRLKVEIWVDNTGSAQAATVTIYYEASAISGNVTCHSQLTGPDLFAWTHDSHGPHHRRGH